MLLTGIAAAEPVTFYDVDSFRAAAGDLVEIDFDTRPDHLRLRETVEITPTFNFADWGVLFSASDSLFQSAATGATMLSNSPDFELEQDAFVSHFIIADFLSPVAAIGIMVPQTTTLTVFDVQDRLVATLTGGGDGTTSFVSVISDVGISRVVADSGSYLTAFDSILLEFTPEPTTLILLAFGLVAVCRRKRRFAVDAANDEQRVS